VSGNTCPNEQSAVDNFVADFSALSVRAQQVILSLFSASQAFPVGSIFVSVVPTNPAALLGYGVWSAFGAGKVLAGLDTTNPLFENPEQTGGLETVTPTGNISTPVFTGNVLPTHSHNSGTIVTSNHTGAAVSDHAAHTHNVTSNVSVTDHASHTHSVTSNVSVTDHAAHTHSVTSNVSVTDHAAHTHTYTQVPNHVHIERAQGGTTGSNTGTHLMTSTATGGSIRSSAQSTLNPTGGVATGTTNNPSIVLNHAVTNNAVNSGNPSAVLNHNVTQPDNHTVSGDTGNASAGTPSGSISTPDFLGDSISVLQPYIVCYFWKRDS